MYYSQTMGKLLVNSTLQCHVITIKGSCLNWATHKYSFEADKVSQYVYRMY